MTAQSPTHAAQAEKGVDVLAVLDKDISVQTHFMPTPLGGTNEHPVRFMERLHDLKRARAAVAELIEAADSALKYSDMASDDRMRLRKALAAVRPQEKQR